MWFFCTYVIINKPLKILKYYTTNCMTYKQCLL